MRHALVFAACLLVILITVDGGQTRQMGRVFRDEVARRRSFSELRRLRTKYLKDIAPYHIMESNVDTLLKRVEDRITGDMKKNEKAHAKRAAALNMRYEKRVHAVEQKLHALLARREQLAEAGHALKMKQANLTRIFRSHEANLDMLSGESQAMQQAASVEKDLVEKDYTVKVEAFAAQKKKRQAMLTEETSVILNVRNLILQLVKANDTRIKDATAATQLTAEVTQTRNRGVNMTLLLAHANELRDLAKQLIVDHHAKKAMVLEREQLHRNASFSSAVQDLQMAGDELQRLAHPILNPPTNHSGNQTRPFNGTSTDILQELLHSVNTSMAPKPVSNDPSLNLMTGNPRATISANLTKRLSTTPLSNLTGSELGEFEGSLSKNLFDAPEGGISLADRVLGKRNPEAGILEADPLTEGMLGNAAGINLITGEKQTGLSPGLSQGQMGGGVRATKTANATKSAL